MAHRAEEEEGLVGEKPPQPHESGRILRAAAQCVCCVLTFVAVLWVAVFVLTCMLLSWANTPGVRAACAGFWDFMLVSVLSPVLIPLVYCMMTGVAGVLRWQLFSGACMLVFAISALYMTLVAAGNHACVEALRETAPPVPWLILVGWFKAAAYGAGALSTLWARL